MITSQLGTVDGMANLSMLLWCAAEDDMDTNHLEKGECQKKWIEMWS